MLLIAEITLSLISGVLALATAMLAIEIFAAVSRKPSPAPPDTGERPDATILIPAYNEGHGLPACLEALQGQVGPQDRILVIADNCTDDTADVARTHGADVLERRDPVRRGKGYALQFGLDYLADMPPDVVLVLDADCRAGPGSIDTLVRTAGSLCRPVQAVYLMETGPDAELGEKLAAFAFKVKNLVRPTGLKRLGLPCPLTGTGMALPWESISGISLATGHIVEDMRLGIDLAITGKPATLEDRALVTSVFPAAEEGRAAQRRRWEHGHLSTTAGAVPRLIIESLRQARSLLFLVALDLLIPPLSFLALLLVLALLLTVVLSGFGGTPFPLVVIIVSITVAMLSLLAAWHVYGRGTISATELLFAPVYAVRKLPIYVDFVRRREREWIRSVRGNEDVRR